MAVVADRVIVELEAKLDRYEANVRRAEQKFDTASRNIQRSAKSVEDSVRRSTDAIGGQLRGLATTFAAAFSVQQVQQFADSYTRFINQLKVAGVEGENLGRVQQALFGIGQQYGVQLESLGTLYSRGSQVSKELGASQAQLIQFTEGVAAALKVQGTSAAESQGALLQLSQLLASGTVRAEEFNSVNEGALPILQAVARNIEAAGGSVGKLKMLVNDGKITSAEFFRAFLEGSEQLKVQAASASTTIAQSFTVLQNALTLYIGQADESLGATEKVAAALNALAGNLDTVATALGVLGAVLLGRVVAGMVTAAASTGVASAAIFALQARAVGAATTMEALAFAGATAGRTLLAAFGGPVGIAVAALTIGIGYLATTSHEAEAATDALAASIASQASEFAHLDKQAAQTAASTNNLTDAQRVVLTATAGLTGEVNLLATAWGRVAAQAKAAAVEQARAAYAKSTTNLVEAGNAYMAKREQVFRAQPRVFVERGLSRDAPMQDAQAALRAAEAGSAAERAQMVQAARNRRNARANLQQIESQKLVEYKAPPLPAAAGKPVKPKAAPKGRQGAKGPDPDDIARRFADDLARGQIELLAAQADALGTAQARRDFERSRIEADRAAANRQTEGEKNLSAAQKAELIALNDKVAAARQDALLAEQRVEDAANALALTQGDLSNQRDLLDAQGRLANSAAEKLAIETRIVELQYQEERLRLEAIVNNTRLNDAEREIARRRLAMLGDLEKLDKENVARQNEGVGARYLRELKGKDINEQLDEVRVRGLQTLEDKIVDVTSKIFKMGGVFGEVANQIISDLIRIAVQRAIIEPLADSLFGSGSGGGAGGTGGGIAGTVGTFIKGLFGGRASGGHVNAGQVYRVTDGEGFRPSQSGKIVPLGQMNKAVPMVSGGSGAGDTNLSVSVVAPGANAQTVELIKQTIADAAPTLITAAQRVTMRSLGRRRMT